MYIYTYIKLKKKKARGGVLQAVGCISLEPGGKLRLVNGMSETSESRSFLKGLCLRGDQRGYFGSQMPG